MKFLIKSQKLDKLKVIFMECSDLLKKFIAEKRFIIIRHHDDTDGYASGVILEKAVKSLIKDNKKHYFVNRISSRTPFFDYIDALHDLNNYLSGYNEKPPLIVLCDLGSNEQSLKAINRLADYGFEFLILDHHHYNNKNKELAKVFLNPHAYGLDSNLSAGALATELALILNPLLTGINHMPALSGIADKSSGEDHKSYMKLSGYSEADLIKWTTVIDHETYYLRFQARARFLEDLFFPGNINIIYSLYKDIEKEFNKIKIAAKKYVRIKDYKKFKLLRIERNKVGGWDYASSKLTRITHDLIEGPRITLSETDDSFSYRCDHVKFSGVDLIEDLNQKLPHALVSGGGHDQAGNVRYNAASKEEIMKYILKYLEKL